MPFQDRKFPSPILMYTSNLEEGLSGAQDLTRVTRRDHPSTAPAAACRGDARGVATSWGFECREWVALKIRCFFGWRLCGSNNAATTVRSQSLAELVSVVCTAVPWTWPLGLTAKFADTQSGSCRSSARVIYPVQACASCWETLNGSSKPAHKTW